MNRVEIFMRNINKDYTRTNRHCLKSNMAWYHGRLVAVVDAVHRHSAERDTSNAGVHTI